MNFHYVFAFSVLIFFFSEPNSIAVAEEDKKSEPHELTNLRGFFEWKTSQAVSPVNEMYLKALDRLQKSHLKLGELDMAMKVLEEKKRIVSVIEAENGSALGNVESRALGSTFENAGGKEKPIPKSSAQPQGSYNLAGTTWVWSASGASIHFQSEGKAFVNLKGGDKKLPFSWERKGKRSFLVRRPDVAHVLVLFEILQDGNTAVYSNISGSSFKRMVSRIPE